MHNRNKSPIAAITMIAIAAICIFAAPAMATPYDMNTASGLILESNTLSTALSPNLIAITAPTLREGHPVTVNDLAQQPNMNDITNLANGLATNPITGQADQSTQTGNNAIIDYMRTNTDGTATSLIMAENQQPVGAGLLKTLMNSNNVAVIGANIFS